MILFYSNPSGGQAGVFTIPYESVDTVTRQQHFAAFPPPPPTFGRFFRCHLFLSMIWLFLWHINVFNIRQNLLAKLQKKKSQNIISNFSVFWKNLKQTFVRIFVFFNFATQLVTIWYFFSLVKLSKLGETGLIYIQYDPSVSMAD